MKDKKEPSSQVWKWEEAKRLMALLNAIYWRPHVRDKDLDKIVMDVSRGDFSFGIFTQKTENQSQLRIHGYYGKYRHFPGDADQPVLYISLTPYTPNMELVFGKIYMWIETKFLPYVEKVKSDYLATQSKIRNRNWVFDQMMIHENVYRPDSSRSDPHGRYDFMGMGGDWLLDGEVLEDATIKLTIVASIDVADAVLDKLDNFT